MPTLPSLRSQENNSKPRSPESFESLRIRDEAVQILGSYEKLSWHSFHRCESLQQTRIHFQHIVAGLTAADEAVLVDWKTDLSPRQPGNGNAEAKEKAGTNSGDAGRDESSTTPKTARTGEGGGSRGKKRQSAGVS